MNGIKTIFNKELLNFAKRKAYIKWYFILIGMNALIPINPLLKGDTTFVMVFLLFTAFLIPNNLSLDAFGGEVNKKTLETLLCMPVKTIHLILGKIGFILVLGLFALISMICLDSILLMLIYKISFSQEQIFIIFIFGMLGILFLSFIGSILSLKIKSLKLCGYVIALFSMVLLVILSYRDKIWVSNAAYWLSLVLLIFNCLILLAIKIKVKRYILMELGNL